MPPEPALGSATSGEIGFLEQDQLGVARDPAREAIGQPKRQRERQHRDRVGAAQARGDDRDSRSQHVHVRVALGHHSPGGLRRDQGRHRFEPARLLDARPQLSQRAKLGHGQEFVGVGTEAEIDHAPRGIQRASARLERAQIGDRNCQHVSEFLRLGAAGIVDHPAVATGKWACKAAVGQTGNGGIEARHEFVPGPPAAACRCSGADRVETEAYGGGGGRSAPAFKQCSEPGRDIVAVRTEIDVDPDAGIEVHAGQRARDRVVGRGQTVTVGANRPGEDEREPGRTVFQIA